LCQWSWASLELPALSTIRSSGWGSVQSIEPDRSLPTMSDGS
jgi:hypothetical protein